MAERPSRSSKRASREGSTSRKSTSRPSAAKNTARPVAKKAGGAKPAGAKPAGAKPAGAKSAPKAKRRAQNAEPAPEAMLDGALTPAQTEQIVEEKLASAVPSAAQGPVLRSSRKSAEQVRAWAVELARLCKDDKCDEVTVLDLTSLKKDYDYIVVASGTSDRQMRSVLRHLEELGGHRGWPAYRVNIDDRATWLIADFLDVVVHLFEPATRSHYDLEMLWGDAARVEWERPDQVDRDRARLSR